MFGLLRFTNHQNIYQCLGQSLTKKCPHPHEVIHLLETLIIFVVFKNKIIGIFKTILIKLNQSKMRPNSSVSKC